MGFRHAPSNNPSCNEGEVLTVEFTVMGIPCIGLNGGPSVEHNWAFSFQVATENQAETDRYWNAIVGNGGEESQCGWCKDKWGLHWQITPIALTQAFANPDRRIAKRTFDAMMTMRKIDVAPFAPAPSRFPHRFAPALSLASRRLGSSACCRRNLPPSLPAMPSIHRGHSVSGKTPWGVQIRVGSSPPPC